MCLTQLRESNYFLFELFAFIRLVALLIPSIAKNVLIQDKICLVDYDQTAAFCQSIHQEFNTTEERQMKDLVLSDAAKFGNYVYVFYDIFLIS